MFGLGGGLFTFAALFYFAAEYEHLTGWKWALASIAVTLTVDQLFPASFIFVLPAQFGLFLVMWWAHVKNQRLRQLELDKRNAEAQRLRREHVRQAQLAADANTDWDAQERERAAAAEAALKERQERVRLAREAREREERERGSGGGTLV
jgi:signal transduction histidine kinase